MINIWNFAVAEDPTGAILEEGNEDFVAQEGASLAAASSGKTDADAAAAAGASFKLLGQIEYV